MRIVAVSNLRRFWEANPDAHDALSSWIDETEEANWKSPNEVKVAYRNASILVNNRVCFNIKGNAYRLIVAIDYKTGIVLIKFIGTHKEYDKVDVATVDIFKRE